jgi:hypothetical protein
MSENSQDLVSSFKGESAKAIYSRLESLRWQTLERARDCSALTLPALIPSQWDNDQVQIPTPYQSIGARGVNNLVAKLLLALFPPGQPFFRLKVREETADELGETLAQVQTELQKVEQNVHDKVEQSHMRPLMSEVFKHLVVGGNALLHIPSKDAMRFFNLHQYCIVRDGIDRPLHVVIKECTVAGSFSREVAAACAINKTDEVAKVDIFTIISWDYVAKRVRSRQEINDKPVPGSDTDRPLDKSEWLPLRWIAVPSRDYGRGQVEEYLGDLRSLEGLSEAMVQFAQAAAKIVILVHPNSQTDVKQINNAESGDAVVGSKADIDLLQIEKQQDFQVADSVAERLEQRISYAFLVQTGTTRQAERVTAEEIRATAQELEDALGGVYTVLAQELQLPLVNRIMAAMVQANEIPSLPKEALNPVVVTGFAALGRNHALQKLRGYLADLSQTFGPAIIAQRVNFDAVQQRYALGYGIEKPSDLWLSDDQVKQQQQQEATQQAMIKAAPGAAPVLAKKIMGDS